VAFSFLTIDSKLGVTLSNFIKPNNVACGQEIKGFHVACRGINIGKGQYRLVEGNLFY
jgi:hypothetical protein